MVYKIIECNKAKPLLSYSAGHHQVRGSSAVLNSSSICNSVHTNILQCHSLNFNHSILLTQWVWSNMYYQPLCHTEQNTVHFSQGKERGKIESVCHGIEPRSTDTSWRWPGEDTDCHDLASPLLTLPRHPALSVACACFSLLATLM